MSDILVGKLRYLRSRTGVVLFIHKKRGIPFWLSFKPYETKHYFVLETDFGEEFLLTFTQVHERLFESQGDNYSQCRPFDCEGEDVVVQIGFTNPGEFDYETEYYPTAVRPVYR